MKRLIVAIIIAIVTISCENNSSGNTVKHISRLDSCEVVRISPLNSFKIQVTYFDMLDTSRHIDVFDRMHEEYVKTLIIKH